MATTMAVPVGSAVNPCCCAGSATIACQRKSGVAQLCGFAEYVNPSTPPNFYRQKLITGSMTIVRYRTSPCTSPTQAATLACAIRGGTASMIGMTEYVSPSSPPMFYLQRTMSGTGSITYYTCDNGTNCTRNCRTCVNSCVGECHYDAVTGVLSNNLTWTKGCTSTPNPYTPNPNDQIIFWSVPPQGVTQGQSQTQQYAVGNNVCASEQDDYNQHKEVGNYTSTLSNPDTEANAIVRLLNGAGGTWGSYATVGAGCSNPACCRAAWQLRTGTMTSFEYKQVKFKITASGLPASLTVYAQVDVMQRTYGTGSYAKVNTIVVSGTTDGSGNLTITDQIVPDYQGYETYVANAVVYTDTSIVDSWNRNYLYTQNTHPHAVTTCDLGETDSSTRTQDGVIQPGGPSESDYVGLATTAYTKTTKTLTGTGVCTYAPRMLGDPYPWAVATGTVSENLTTQDMPADAIARDEPVKTWQACTLGCPSCSAFTVQSANSALVYYSDVQVQFNATGLAASTVYYVTIKLKERTWGTVAAFQAFDTIEVSFNSGSQSSFLSSWYEVPSTPGIAGYAQEVIAASVLITH
jgi:hypothetical protein